MSPSPCKYAQICLLLSFLHVQSGCYENKPKLKGGKESPIQLIKSPSSLFFLSTPQRPHPGRPWLLLARFSTPALFGAIGTPVPKQKAGLPLCGDVLLHLTSWETEEGSGMPVSSRVDARRKLNHCAAENSHIPHRWPPLRLLSC